MTTGFTPLSFEIARSICKSQATICRNLSSYFLQRQFWYFTKDSFGIRQKFMTFLVQELHAYFNQKVECCKRHTSYLWFTRYLQLMAQPWVARLKVNSGQRNVITDLKIYSTFVSLCRQCCNHNICLHIEERV